MRLIPFTLALTMGCVSLVAADEKTKTAERLDDAAVLFSEIMGTPDKSIPQDLLDKARCVVLIPGLKKAALGWRQVRARYVVCRQPSGGLGRRPPCVPKVEAWVQIGVSSSDVVLLIMNDGA